jgi:Flp pilus assembly protein TadD
METVMHPIGINSRAILVLAVSLMSAVAITAVGSSRALAVDTVTSKDAPDLTSVRAKIKAKDYQAALVELRTVADTHQHADVYSFMGFSLRKTGDYPTALTFYKKALEIRRRSQGCARISGRALRGDG